MIRFSTAVTVAALVLVNSLHAEKAPQKVVDLANSILVSYGNDAVIVKAVTDQNARGASLDDIKKIDETWRKTAGTSDFMKKLINSECAPRLKSIIEKHPFIVEVFVMDNQGANVAMNDKTSDYWQGDEAKFTESFAGGKGAVFVDDVEFDDSSQSYLVQISVPVRKDGVAVGAITFGVDVDKVQ